MRNPLRREVVAAHGTPMMMKSAPSHFIIDIIIRYLRMIHDEGDETRVPGNVIFATLWSAHSESK